MVLKLTTLDSKVFPFLEGKGISLGVTIITIAVLVPIASGSIGFKDLGEAIKSPYAWIALVSGIAVALLAKNGLILLNPASPQQPALERHQPLVDVIELLDEALDARGVERQRLDVGDDR